MARFLAFSRRLRFIFLFLVVTHVIAFVFRQDFYPIQVYWMYTLRATGRPVTWYVPYFKDTSGRKVPRRIQYWPINYRNITTSLDRWDNRKVLSEKGVELCKDLLAIMQKKYPEDGLRCCGVAKNQAASSSMKDYQDHTSVDAVEYCDQT